MHGYHQFPIDDQSRRIMTFSTPWGNYRYKRLAFGGLNSQDLFDAEIAKIISGIPRVLNMQPRQHHDRRTQWLGRSQHQPESRSTTDRRSQSNPTKGKMWVRENDDEFPRTHVHRRKIEAKPGQGPSRTRMHTTEDQRRASVILANASVSFTIHQQSLEPLRAASTIDKD